MLISHVYVSKFLYTYINLYSHSGSADKKYVHKTYSYLLGWHTCKQAYTYLYIHTHICATA